jgi:hypothetical protein
MLWSFCRCATLARDLDQIIRLPWREIRLVIGSPDTVLQATIFARFATPASSDRWLPSVSPLHRWGLGDKERWSGSQRPTSADSLQRLAIVIVIRAAKRRDSEGSQINQRRCGVERLTED